MFCELFVDATPKSFAYILLGEQRFVRAETFPEPMTVNEAEYTALIYGMEAAMQMGYTSLAIYSDSQLVVRQVARKYKVKEPRLKPLWERVLHLKGIFKTCTITHIRGIDNPADVPSREAAYGPNNKTRRRPKAKRITE